MNKRMTCLVVFLALLCALLLPACDNGKKARKAAALKECLEGGEKQFEAPEIRTIFHDYCECSAEKMAEAFSTKDWADFDTLKKQGRDAEMKDKLMPVIEPCVDELKQKVAEKARNEEPQQ